MSGFPILGAGDDAERLLLDQNWLNGCSRAIDATSGTATPPPLPDGFGRQPYFCKIKNNSGADVGRYGILGVDGPLFDKTANEKYFLAGELQFKGVKPKAEHAGRTAHCLGPIKAGKIGYAIIPNAIQVKVNLTTATHRFASIIDDDTAKLESGESGTYPMVPGETGTGVKWCVMFLAGGGGAPAAGGVDVYLARVTGPVGGIPAATLTGSPAGTILKLFKGTAVRYSVKDVADPGFGDAGDLAEPEQEDATSIQWLLETHADAAKFPDTITRQDAGEQVPAQITIYNWVKAIIQPGDRVVIVEATTVKGRKRSLIMARDCG